MPLFKKRPIVVDAVQWNGPGHDVRGVYIWPNRPGDLQFSCLTAQLREVEPCIGDWIVLETDQGGSSRLQSYPVRNDIFWQTFRPLNWFERLLQKLKK